MDAVTAVVDEALKEAIGTSRRRWALVVVAFAAGALGAFWIIRRARSATPETVQPDDTPS
jgi:hypothetical protein